MDSNIGSQEHETILKFLNEQDEFADQQENLVGTMNQDVGAQNPTTLDAIELDLINSQFSNNQQKQNIKLKEMKSTQQWKSNLHNSGATKKRNYADLLNQTATDSEAVRLENGIEFAKSKSAVEPKEQSKRMKVDEQPTFSKRQSCQFKLQDNQIIVDQDMEDSFKIPYNENQKSMAEQQSAYGNRVQSVGQKGQPPAQTYKLELVREPPSKGAQSFADLLQDFALISINSNNENDDPNSSSIKIKKRINQENHLTQVNDNDKYVKNENLKTMLKITDLLITNNCSKKSCEQDYVFEVVDVNKLQSYQDSYDEDDLLRIVQVMTPKNHRWGVKVGQRFFCDQQILRRVNAAVGNVSLVWVMHNVGAEEFLNKVDENFIKHYVDSGLFQTLDGYLWKLRFQTGCWPQSNMNYQQIEQFQNSKSTRSKICIFAVPTTEERQKKKMNRRVSIKYGLFNNSKVQSLKHWAIDDFVFTNETRHAHLDQFCQMSNPRLMRMNGTSEQFCIHINISHLVPEETDHEEEKVEEQQVIQEKKRQPQQLFKGLKNEGTTCYLNSVIQALFFIRPFRNAIYRMPTISLEMNRQKLEKSIPFCLQRIFYNLQLGDQQKYVRTHELLQAFGWDINDINQQQDVSEFNQILNEQLDKQMENTQVQGTFQQLFEGEYENVMKCVNVDYESTRKEKFITISLNVKDNHTIQDSFREFMAEERLDGKNQYETPKHGKQDALKFIRFKRMPPILQIQLRRYEFDVNVGNFVKSNQKLKFQETLDFGSIKLNKSAQSGNAVNNQSQENLVQGASEWSCSQTTLQKNKQINQQNMLFSQYAANSNVKKQGGEGPNNVYHLHSILVHRGSINSGHYFAFIKPTLEDRWYEFNDDRVTEVTKEYAFSQGIGGDTCSFEMKREAHEAYPDSTSMIIQRHRENFTNAYMLIYIREHERASILDDQRFTLDKQIPPELQLHFKIEELFKDQITADWTQYKNYSTIYLLSDEIIENSKWKGSFILPRMSDTRSPEEYRFEQNQDEHLQLCVHQHMCLNEFIIMLRDRFFNKANGWDIELEDIWLYKILQPQKNQKTMNKLTYSLENKYDCPLFSKNTTFNTQDWEQQKQKNEQKWKKSSLLKELYLYIQINPAKLKDNQRIIRRLSEEEITSNESHFNDFTTYIRKTDMANGQQYVDMYDEFQRARYVFDERGSSADPDGDAEMEIQDAETRKVEKQNSGEKWDEIEKKKDIIQQNRRRFIFALDEQLREKQKKEYEQCAKERDQSMHPPAPKQMDCVIFVKIANAETKNIRFAFSHTITRLNEPLDIDNILEMAEVSAEEYDVYIDPQTNFCLRHQIDLSASGGGENSNPNNNQRQQFEQMSIEQYRQNGLIKQTTQNNLDTFKIDKEQMKKVPFNRIIKPSRHGLCLILLKKHPSDPEKTPEQIEQQQNRQLLKQIQWHENSVYIYLNYIHDMDGLMNVQRQINIGTFEFNQQYTCDQIISDVVKHFLEARQDDQQRYPMPDIPPNENLKDHIQLFNSNSQVITFGELLQSPKFDDACQPLQSMINSEHEVNFTIVGPLYSKIDREDVARFTVHDSNSLLKSHAAQFLRLQIERQATFSDFSALFKESFGFLEGDKQLYPRADQNQELSYRPVDDFLILEIDRQTQNILKVYDPKQTHMYQIVGRKNDLKINWVQKIVRLQLLTPSESEFIDQVRKGSRECGIAFVTVYDQFRQRRQVAAVSEEERQNEEAGATKTNESATFDKNLQQFAIPFDAETNLLSDLVLFIKDKLKELKTNPNNNLASADIDSLRVWSIKYNNKMNVARGQIFQNSFDWRNPTFNHELKDEILSIPLSSLTNNEQPSSKNGPSLYQPYSSTPNGQGMYHFAYFAAQLNFSDEIQKVEKKIESAPVRAIAIGGSSQNDQTGNNKSKS